MQCERERRPGKKQQQERDVRVLATKRMTLREEDLFRQSLGEVLPAGRSRRGTHPTIRQVALTKLAPDAAMASSSPSSSPVDQILAQTLQRLNGSTAPEAPQA
jgi:hypothetical protein